MNELRTLLQESLNSEFISAALSNPRDRTLAERIRVRPVLKGEQLLFQLEIFRNRQAFHENLDREAAAEQLLLHMQNMR